METSSLVADSCEQDDSFESKENITESNILTEEISESSIKPKKVRKSNKRLSEKFSEIKQNSLEVSVEDLKNLCEQISTLNDRISHARKITNLRYELPIEMKDKLELEAQELECLHAELQDATRNLEIIQQQRAALGKERDWMETQITKLKADAVAEMEMIVSVYDGSMMERWEQVKQSNTTPEVENFLHDVKGKLEAMKNLQTLGVNKLAELQNLEKKKGETAKKEKKRINREERWVEGGAHATRGGPYHRNGLNPSQTTLPLFFDTESDLNLIDESTVLNNVMYSLVYDQVLNLNFPAWAHGPLDID